MPAPGTAHRARHAPQRAGADGFSLIEVLIALVILSVGLLGLAVLQAEGLRGSSSALQRTLAVAYASDIADRMRANRAGITAAAPSPYVIAIGDKANDGASLACAEDIDGSGNPVAAATCTAQQMARHDLFKWKDEMDDRGYDGSITAVAGTTTQFTLLVQWTDRTVSGAPAQTYQAVVQF